MGFYIATNGVYYEGDRIGSDQPVPLRPDANHVWDGARWVPDTAKMAAAARAERNTHLSASDWTQMPDAPLAPGQRSAWAGYRQALRDISAQDGFPASINWPVAP